jgi:ABC-type amino acid transport substrate-binding protein
MLVQLLSILFITQLALAKTTLNVGLEPLPPLVIDAKNGHVIDILKAMEKITPYQFQVSTMPYSRAKYYLKNSKKIDIIGIVPSKKEEKKFYDSALEVPLNIKTISDLYYKDKTKLAEIEQSIIGVPYGNAEFIGQLLGLPLKNFHEGKIDGLLKMLEAGRIDLFFFERASTMTRLKALGIKNIRYHSDPKNHIDIALAVKKNEDGKALAKELTKALKKIDIKDILKAYLPYFKMPNAGVVKVD